MCVISYLIASEICEMFMFFDALYINSKLFLLFILALIGWRRCRNSRPRRPTSRQQATFAVAGMVHPIKQLLTYGSQMFKVCSWINQDWSKSEKNRSKPDEGSADIADKWIRPTKGEEENRRTGV